MSQFFLWLTSVGESYDRLAELIDQLSEQYRGPRFEPHLTLLGGIEGEDLVIYEHVRTLANRLRPIIIDLQQPAYGDEYFRCLFFPVRETLELLDAHEQANVILGNTSTVTFFPHVSLLYGLFPKRVKRDILASFPTNLPKQFLASELKLIRTESLNPQDWHLVETMSLQA